LYLRLSGTKFRYSFFAQYPYLPEKDLGKVSCKGIFSAASRLYRNK